MSGTSWRTLLYEKKGSTCGTMRNLLSQSWEWMKKKLGPQTSKVVAVVVTVTVAVAVKKSMLETCSGRVSIRAKLYKACRSGNLDVVKRLLTLREQDVSIWEESMMIAYGGKHMDIVGFIRDRGRVPIHTQLHQACQWGDMEFVKQYIAKDRNRGHYVDWERLMKTAYDSKHMDIVRCIKNSEGASVDRQLYGSCLLGDLEFVKQCIDKDRGHCVDWERMMKTAYDSKHIDIVRCIKNSEGASVDRQLYGSCLLGDLEFVKRCIDKARGHYVDWERMMKTAYDSKHMDIVRCIKDSEGASVDRQLYGSCLLGDLEFVKQCIAKGSDRDQGVNWKRLIDIVYDKDRNHVDIVRCIRDSRRVSVDTQLYYSCLLGDLGFVSYCISHSIDIGHNVDWDRLIKTAYENQRMHTVCCIRLSERVTVDTRLYYACLQRDLEFVSQYITEDKDKGQNVNWRRLIETTVDRADNIAQEIVNKGRFTLADTYPLMEDDYRLFVIEHTEDVNKEIRPELNTLHVAAYMCVDRWDGYENLTSDIINRVLNKKAEVNGKGFMGRTALHFLCHGQNIDVDNIIEVKTEPNGSKQHLTKKSILHVGGKLSENVGILIDNIIKHGGDIKATDNNGQTPLHLLCLSEGDVSIGTVLIERGADINKRDNEGRTPLAVAAQHGNEKFVSFLCGKSCDKNMGTFPGETPLYLSAVANNIRSAEILCENGVDVNQADEYNVTPLAAACECDNHLIVDMLLEYRAEPYVADMEEKTALHIAALNGSTESCQRLIEANIGTNVRDITGCTPLHLCITRRKLQTIKVLLDAKCEVNIENNLGNMPLHNATSLSSGGESVLKDVRNMAEILLQKGAEIEHRNNYGHTPMMMSARVLNFPMLNFFYDHKSNLDSVDNMQGGLIHNVVDNYPLVCLPQPHKFQECQAIIKWLIEKGLSINASDVNEQTPLHLAAQQGDLELVTFLVNSGSDVTRRDKFRHMSVMNALDHPEVFRYLWEKTLPDITDDDFCKLQRLCYWLNISEEIKSQIIKCAPNVIELRNMPQNVKRLTLRYGDSLEKWLRTENEELPEFMANWLTSLQHLTYIDHPTINKVMWEFLNDLQEGVRKEDPFVAYDITRCGSVEEKTKAFAQDENDCSCVLQNIRFEMFETPTQADHPEWKAFVHLKCKEEYFENLKRVLDGNNQLSQGKLCHCFGKAIGKVLANPAFWAKYPQLQRISANDITAGDRRICTMHVIWSDEIYPWLKIDIDLAPVIDLSKWKPSWCNKHELLEEIECIALPKWKMTHEVNMDLMEIGVHSWGPLFNKMPEEMRQGYRLAKVVCDSAVCPQIRQPSSEEGENGEEYVDCCNAKQFMNTYLLKQVIIQEYTEWYDQKKKGLDPRVHTDVFWARRIYEKMEGAFRHRELYSWFIPTYNLLTDDKFVQFKDTAILYARLCQRLLTEEAADHFRKAYLGSVPNKNPPAVPKFISY